MMTQKLGRLVVGFLVISACTYSPSALSTLSFKLECPKKFIGKVRMIRASSKNPLNSLERLNVYFENQKNFKGQNLNTVEVQVLKNGPIQFEEGQSYLVEMNNGLICKATEV